MVYEVQELIGTDGELRYVIELCYSSFERIIIAALAP